MVRSQNLSTAFHSRHVGRDFNDRHPSRFAKGRGSLCQRFGTARIQHNVYASFCQGLCAAETQALAGTAHERPATLYS